MYDVLKLEKFPEDEAGADRKFLVRVDDVVRRRYQMCHPGNCEWRLASIGANARRSSTRRKIEGVEWCGRIEIKLRYRVATVAPASTLP